MRNRQGQFRSFKWLTAVAGGAILLLVVSLVAIARHEDVQARTREESLVANGLRERMREVAHSSVPQVVWDDAVAHLQNTFDAAWAKDNIGVFFTQTDGFEQAWVFGAADQPLYGMSHGQPASVSDRSEMSTLARPMIDDVRRQEALRQSSTSLQTSATRLGDPIQTTRLIRYRDDLYIFTATLVQPDFGRVKAVGGRAPIVVSGEAMDANFLRTFAGRFLLKNVHMHAEDTRSEADEAHAALMAVDGRVLGTLDWTPQKPGTILLATAATPILAVVFGLILAAFYFYTRGRKSTESLIASEARAKHMALHDALTSLPNRLLFSDRLGHALQSLRRDNEGVAVLCIDLDHFKDVNDTLGHHCGDALLCEVAARLTAACRSSDTLARLGGDEFAVVQSRATPASAAALGERIIQALRGPVSLPAGEATLSCSVGATLITQPGQDAGEVVRQADIALYQAKDRGRGQVRFFEPEMDAALRARKLIEADLQKALANNELFMAFQPQMDGHGQMTGVEALMRWTHPERGPISPAFFIPIAEQSRLIHDLGRFALEEAFGASCRWPSLKVAVNVSAHQLRAPDFLREVKQMVAKSGVDPRNVDLEITEGVLLDDDGVTHDVLKRLKHMGFTLALDDFGTGYSSLSYLRRYPVDKIKIDRSFITGLGVDRESEAVVGAIVRLAKALNLEVIAEGVETDGQRTELGRAGCSNIQGFLFGRPETPAQIDHRLVGRSKARPLNALAS